MCAAAPGPGRGRDISKRVWLAGETVAVLRCIVLCTATELAADCALQEDGRTALHCASEKGHVECALLLADCGSGLDLADVSSCLTHPVGWASSNLSSSLVDVCLCARVCDGYWVRAG
jgi:hypothetical protein